MRELRHHPDAAKRLGASAALKAAQAYVRAQPGWEHPRYWAAWQLWGRRRVWILTKMFIIDYYARLLFFIVSNAMFLVKIFGNGIT